MKRMLVVALLVTGCTSTKATAVVGTAMSVAGGALLVTAERGDCTSMGFDEAIDCGVEETGSRVLGTTLLVVGAGALIAAAVSNWREPPTPEAIAVLPELDAPAEPRTADPVLRQLTLQAGVAARAGRCTTVVVIARRVGELDGTYRDVGFADDPHVASCLR